MISDAVIRLLFELGDCSAIVLCRVSTSLGPGLGCDGSFTWTSCTNLAREGTFTEMKNDAPWNIKSP